MKSVLLSLLVPLCGCLVASAQETGEGERREPAGRLAWFAATTIPDDLENPVDVMTGKDITKVTLSRRTPSEPVKIPADGIIRIVRRVENPDDPQNPRFLTLAQALVPEGISKALVILLPAAKSEAGLIYQTKVQDLANFKGGDTLYLNLTKVNLAIRLGEERIALRPGDIRMCAAPTLARSTNTPVSYHYFHPTQEKWKLLSASTVVLRPTRREICIFSWDPRYERVDYHGITFPVTP